MLKAFCDTCGEEVKNGENNYIISFTEFDILNKEVKAKQKEVLLCKECGKKMKNVLAEIQKDNKK